MSMWDNLLPHRFFINRALRKASDELRDHIDSYRIEHEMAVQRCRNEIEAAKVEKDRQFELRKQEYLHELSQDSYALGELQTLFLDYVDLHLKKELLYLIKSKMILELQLLYEYGDFLTEQMRLIGEEISILEQRQESLSLQVRIDDVIALISITGADLSCDASDNPKTLLEKVNLVIFECKDISPQTKSALVRLKKLLQERAEYLPLIQYIAWLIQQKKSLSQDLFRERRTINESKKPLKNQLSAIKAELNQLNAVMLDKAICIRSIWAKPLAEIFVELASVTELLDQKYARQKYISAEIRTMKSERSNDSDRWEQLQAEGKSVYEAIGQLNSKKTNLFEQRQQWFNRKNKVLDLFKKNRVFLLSPKDGHTSDEIRVLTQRRTELLRKIEDVNLCLKEQNAQVLSERYHQETVLAGQILTAEKAISKKKQSMVEAEQRVKKLKEQDTRSFVARIFSESKDVIKAKERQDEVRCELLQAEQHLAVLQNKLNAVNAACEKQLLQVNQQHKRQISEYQGDISGIDLAIAFIQKKKKR